MVLIVFASRAPVRPFRESNLGKNMNQPAIYIMSNKRNGTIYTGVTSNLVKRVYEHKNKVTQGLRQSTIAQSLSIMKLLRVWRMP
jgi:excinuclease UvrABC nuclease subunit